MGVAELKLDPTLSGLSGFVEKPGDYVQHDMPGVIEGDTNKIEPEDKWMIPDHYDDLIFKQIHDLFSSPTFPKISNIDGAPVQYEDNIFLSDNIVKARAPLLSISKDTVDSDGTPTYLITASGEQFRSRGPLIIEEDEDGFETMYLPRGQATIKTLLSALAPGEDRKEREASASADFLMASQEYLDGHRHLLPEVFKDINESDFRASAICLVPRASFNVTVFVSKYGAFVEFEVCTDPCTHMTPNCDEIVAQDRELEYETKGIYVRSDKSVSAAYIKEIADEAKKMMAERILSAFPDFEVAKFSKMERANIAVAQHYHNKKSFSLKGSARRSFQIFSTICRLGKQYECMKLRQGMIAALSQNVTEHDIVNKKLPAIMRILKQLPKAEDLIPVSDGARHKMDAFHETTREAMRTAYRCRLEASG